MKTVLAILLFFNLFSFCQAQDVFNGTILKSDGKPSKGTEVRVMDSKKKVKTDKQGKFYFETISDTDSVIIKVSRDKDLIFLPGKNSELKITLGEETATIYEGDKIFAVAYRVKNNKTKRSDLLTSEDIIRLGSRTFMDAVKTIPGVNMRQGTLAIRGVNSFNSSTEPLFILDGSETSLAALESLDIYTIESIQVNKTGFGYGVKGANGVIMVKTKKK